MCIFGNVRHGYFKYKSLQLEHSSGETFLSIWLCFVSKRLKEKSGACEYEVSYSFNT